MSAYEPRLARAAKLEVRATGVLSVAFGCPFEGEVDPEAVIRLARQFVDAGATAIDFADTVGMAVPTQVNDMLRRARLEFGDDVALGIHLHNTRNAGIVNLKDDLPFKFSAKVQISGSLTSDNLAACTGEGYVEVQGDGLLGPAGIVGLLLLGAGGVGLLFNARPAMTFKG